MPRTNRNARPRLMSADNVGRKVLKNDHTTQKVRRAQRLARKSAIRASR